MQKDIKEIKQSIADVKALIVEIKQTKADKWVERAMTVLITVIVLAALYTIFTHSGLVVR